MNHANNVHDIDAQRKIRSVTRVMRAEAASQPDHQAAATRRMAYNLKNPEQIADGALTVARIDAKPSAANADLVAAMRAAEVERGLRHQLASLRREIAKWCALAGDPVADLDFVTDIPALRATAKAARLRWREVEAAAQLN